MELPTNRAELEAMSERTLREMDRMLEGVSRRLWAPQEGPQTLAYLSEADVVGFGGAAGGGKTDLALGLALTQHRTVGVFRQNGTELTAVVDRLAEILGTRDGWDRHGILRTRRGDGEPVQIELGSFPNTGDEQKYRGRPHDLLVFDEAAEMREFPVRFLMGWLRTTTPGQRCRALLCFNPPQTVEGRWILEYFAPWLDRKHPRPAEPGELRWFATVDGKDIECDDGTPFVHQGELVEPQSRTFVPSRVADNAYLRDTGYMRQLKSLPEPLRSQLLYGDFHAGVEDSVYQVIPTAWVEAAMERWTRAAQLPPMDSIGVDVAMGGKDNTVIARRHGMWFDEPVVYPGGQCKDGPTIAGFVVAAKRNHAPIHIDLFGVGAQPFGHLMSMGQQVYGVNVGDPAKGVTRDGGMQFANLRSELWWRMREALDPAANSGICLPPDKRLLADLCAPTWSVKGAKIAVASRDELVALIGRSPDYGSAYVLALIDVPKLADIRRLRRAVPALDGFDPYADF